MSDHVATHYVKSRVIGTASGLYWQDGEILRPIMATDEGKMIDVPVSWKNNHAIDVFKLVEGLSDDKY